MTSRLAQLRAARRDVIRIDPVIITPLRPALVDDGFGGFMPSGDPVARSSIRVRISHESASVQGNGQTPAGLDTSLSYFLIADYAADLAEKDTFAWDGHYWTVGPVNAFRIDGAVFGYEAPITRGTEVPVTIPADLVAEAKSATTIDVTWTDTGAVNSYSVERKTGSADFAVVASPAAGVLVFHDTGLTSGTTYVYRMRAYDGNAFSEYTGEVSEATP
jgi:hypothetical protein